MEVVHFDSYLYQIQITGEMLYQTKEGKHFLGYLTFFNQCLLNVIRNSSVGKPK